MPVMELSERSSACKAPFVGETEFTAPDDENEYVKMFIYLAQPEFVEEALQESFGQFNTDKVDFVASLRSYVLQHQQ